MHYNTHVFAVVRIEVDGTNCADEPEMVAKDVAEAIAKSPEEWMKPILGHIDIDGAGSFKVSAVEFASEVNWTVVDELDKPDGEVVREHHFDVTGEPMIGRHNFCTAREARLYAEVEQLRNQMAALAGIRKAHLEREIPPAGNVMQTKVSVADVTEIISRLLNAPESVGECFEPRKFQSFLTALAQAICDHCGGEIFYLPSEENNWHIGIKGNDSLPEGSEGVWAHKVIPF